METQDGQQDNNITVSKAEVKCHEGHAPPFLECRFEPLQFRSQVKLFIFDGVLLLLQFGETGLKRVRLAIQSLHLPVQRLL